MDDNGCNRYLYCLIANARQKSNNKDINISFQNHDTFNNLKAFVDVLAEKCDFQSY